MNDGTAWGKTHDETLPDEERQAEARSPGFVMLRTTTNGAPVYPVSAGTWRVLNVIGGVWVGALLSAVVIGLTPPGAWLVIAAALLTFAAWYVAKSGVWVW